MGSVQEPNKISILERETILLDYDIWGSYIAQDLLNNVPSSTYVLVTDTNLYEQYVPSFEKSFQEAAEAARREARLLTYQIPPGESSKSRGGYCSEQRQPSASLSCRNIAEWRC